MGTTTTLDAGQAPDFAPSVDVGHGYPPGYDPSIPRGRYGSEYRPGQSGSGYDPVDVQARVRKRLLEHGYPEAAVRGMLRRLGVESRFDPGAVGDGGTSYGLMQAHNEPGNAASQRMDDLKAFAKEQKKPLDDPEMQADFIDHELKTRFPGLRKDLMATTDSDVSYGQFTKVYENPAQTMIMKDAQGNWVIGNSMLSFSPGRKRGPISMMSPEDFLALAKDDDFPNERKRKSLAASLDAGEPIEELPSLDVKHKAGEPTGTVTDADGRHRALAAQDAGLPSIPVEMNGAQSGLTELTGQQGKTLPIHTPPRSGLMDWLVPKAQAQEVPPSGGYRPEIESIFRKPPAEGAAAPATGGPAAAEGVGTLFQKPPPDEPQDEDPYMYYAGDMPRAGLAGAVRGALDVPLGIGQNLAEDAAKGGWPGAPWAAQNMLKAIQAVHGLTDPAIQKAPLSGEFGEAAGVLPYYLVARKFFGPAAANQVIRRGFWPVARDVAWSGVKGGLVGAGTGALSGFFAPEETSGDEYWQSKWERAPYDMLFGGLAGSALSSLGAVAGPVRRTIAERAEHNLILQRLPIIRDSVVNPIRDQLMTQTRVARSNITPLMQQFIESPTGQKGIKAEIERARKDVLGHGASFNEATFGVRPNTTKPKDWVIDPEARTGTRGGTAPSMRFLDGVRRQMDTEIDGLRKKLAGDPHNTGLAHDLQVAIDHRRQYTDELRRQFPGSQPGQGYGDYLDMVDAFHLVGRTLQDSGVEGIKLMLRSPESLLRAIGNLGYGSHMYAMGNALHAVMGKLRGTPLTANQLAQVQQARGQLPGMPPMRAVQSANALRQLMESMGTGAAAVEPRAQMVPGI